MTPDEMAREIQEVQTLTITDPEKVTAERTKRALRILFALNQSKTGPARKKSTKASQSSEPLPSVNLTPNADGSLDMPFSL